MAGLIPFNRKSDSFFAPGIFDLHNMLDDFFTDNRFMGRNLSCDTFKIDVENGDREYIVSAELPGISKDEIDLDLTEGKLTISIKKEENSEEQKKSFIHKERRYTSMARSIFLSDSDPADIKAKLEDGVLLVTVPKIEKKSNSSKIYIE